MIASVGTGEYGRLRSCLEKQTALVWQDRFQTEDALATGQRLIRWHSAADRLEAVPLESLPISSFQAKPAAEHPDSDSPQMAARGIHFTSVDHTAIHLNVFSSWLQYKASLVFCSTAIAAMQLLGEGHRIIQSECAGGGRKAKDELGSNRLHALRLQGSFPR